MRLLRLSLLAVAVALPTGCSWFDKIKPNGNLPPSPGNKTPLQPLSPEQLVGYLNTQSARLNALAYERVSVTAKEGLVAYPSFDGTVVASQPKYFHMTARGKLAAKIDLGSNPDEFWLYVDAPTVKPMFVYASHTDFAQGRAAIPGNLPFEPDWVMQALGMTTFPDPKAVRYEVTPNQRDRTYALSWPATTPNGTPIRKEVVFAADDADSSRDQPQVRQHVIRGANNKVICTADVKGAKTVTVGGTDPRTGQPFVVQYPTRIVLRWVEQKFEMDLDLRAAQVNPQLTPEQMRGEFTRPTRLGPAINLADGRFEVPTR